MRESSRFEKYKGKTENIYKYHVLNYIKSN